MGTDDTPLELLWEAFGKGIDKPSTEATLSGGSEALSAVRLRAIFARPEHSFLTKAWFAVFLLSPARTHCPVPDRTLLRICGAARRKSAPERLDVRNLPQRLERAATPNICAFS